MEPREGREYIAEKQDERQPALALATKRGPPSPPSVHSQLRLPPTLHELRPAPSNAQLPRLHDPRLKHNLPTLPPHLRPERLARHHRPGKPDLDVPERTVRLIDMLAREAERAQAMQDRLGEAADLSKVRVDMQRITIATEAIKGSLLGGRLLVDGDVRVALRRRVGSGGGAAVGAFLGPAEAAAAAEEEGHFVVEEVAAGAGVGRGGGVDEDGGGALVDDVEELGAVDEAGRGGDGVLADLEVLFAVEEHHGREVGDEVRHVPGRRAAEAGDHAVGGEDLEVVRVLVDEGEVGAFGAYSEVWMLW